MNFLKLGIFIVVLVTGRSIAQNVPQSPNYQSPLFSDMMNDLRKAYEARLNDVHKRLALQEERFNELLGTLRGPQRERRLLEGLQQTRSGNVPQSPNYQSPLFSNMMNDLRKAYEARLNDVHKRLALQEERFNELLGTLRGPQRGIRRRLLNGLQQTTPAPPSQRKVAFYVQLSHDLTGIGAFQAIVFDQVTTNIGNGYNKVNGMFTAPASATYVFSWTTASADNHHMQTELVVNNNQVGLTWSDSGNHNDYSLASNTVVVELKAGDVVWVRSNSIHSHTLHGQKMTTFSGWLLFQE